MRYEKLPSALYTRNRKALAEQLKANELAVFNANDVMPTNADGTMPFKQNSDFFWLSGVDQEESVLIIFPDHPVESQREVLFLRLRPVMSWLFGMERNLLKKRPENLQAFETFSGYPHSKARFTGLWQKQNCFT